METRVIHWILKVLLVLAALVGVIGQVLFVPLAAGEYAYAGLEGVTPETAKLFLSIAGVLAVACLQVVMVAMWRLLDLVAVSRIFDTASLRWVNVMIGAFVAAGVLSLIVAGYLMMPAGGHLFVTLFVLLCAAAGFGVALLLVVMRALLVQATTLQTEMAAVI